MSVQQRAVTDAERWFRERYSATPERAVPFTTLSGESVRALYGPEDVGAFEERIGFPGEPPFTRGVYPRMYRGRLWTMRQFAGFGTAEETNERFRYLLEHGQTGLSTAFDMPSLMGHDSDHPRSLGEVGREGVAVDSLDDMQTLFGGIDLGAVTVSMTINAPAAIMMAFYVVAAQYFHKIDELGGMVEAVKQGFPQREIADAAYQLQREIDRGERIVVGVNDCRDGDDAELEILRIDPALERKQIGRVQAVRARRDTTAVETTLTALREAAATERNLMPPRLDCARVHATEGEVVSALQDVWGSYTETPVF